MGLTNIICIILHLQRRYTGYTKEGLIFSRQHILSYFYANTSATLLRSPAPSTRCLSSRCRFTACYIFFPKNPAHRPRRRRTPHPSDSLISSPSCCGVIISHHLQQCFGSGGSLLQSGSCDSPDLLLGDLFPAEADRINAKSPPGLDKLSLSFLFNLYNR